MLADDIIALAARDRIQDLAIPNLTVFADLGQPTREQTLPICDVFVAQDNATPYNDERTSWAHYNHSITLAIEVTAAGNSQREAKAWLSAAGEMILDAFLSDRDWAKRDGKPIIEGFGGLRRGYLAPPEPDTFIVKLQIELQVLIKSQFMPSTDLLPALETLSAGLKPGVSGEDVPISITFQFPEA